MRGAEFQPIECIEHMPHGARGVYALLKQDEEEKDSYQVVYVGMSSSGIYSRLKSHRLHKQELWTHFTFMEVWPNVPEQQIRELEGILRHLYRKDPDANKLAKALKYGPLVKILRRKPLNRKAPDIRELLKQHSLKRDG